MMYVFSEGKLTRHQRYALAERDAMISRDGWICWRCGCYLPGQRGGRAHRIARTETNLARFGPYVLDHHENIRHSCDGCNSYAMRFDSKAERESMLATIQADLQERGLPVTGEEHRARRRLAKNQRLEREKALRKAAMYRERLGGAEKKKQTEKERRRAYYLQHREELCRLDREKKAEARKTAGTGKRKVWHPEDRDGIQAARQRLHSYVNYRRKKYGSRYAEKMSAAEVRKMEKLRADLEAVLFNAKKITIGEGDD